MDPTTPAKILVADDESLYLRTTGDLLRREGYACTCVSDAYAAKAKLAEDKFDLILSDLNMPGNLELELLHEQQRSQAPIPTIVVTGVPSLPTAIESIRLGIADYLLKPVKFDDLLRSIKRVLAHDRQSTTQQVPAVEQFTELFPGIVGQSPPMLELFEIIDRVASTDANILITGESGTGKEVIAQAIHTHSHRKMGKLQVIDCTAIPESLFESMLFGHKKGSFTGAVSDAAGLLMQCDGGTAFFDEIGELPAALQSKLLRVIQEQTFIPVGSHHPVSVNTRFICATNRDLEREVQAGRFRQDLFYRLGVIHIELPTLRERGDDILLLAEHFLRSLNPHQTTRSFSSQAQACLRNYPWPGNIRELRNTIERSLALARSPVICKDDFPTKIQCPETLQTSIELPQYVPAEVNSNTSPREQSTHAAPCDQPTGTDVGADAGGGGAIGEVADNGRQTQRAAASRDEALETAEQEYLCRLLETHHGNVSEAAREAGLSRQGLHKLLKKYAIAAANFR